MRRLPILGRSDRRPEPRIHCRKPTRRSFDDDYETAGDRVDRGCGHGHRRVGDGRGRTGHDGKAAGRVDEAGRVYGSDVQAGRPRRAQQGSDGAALQALSGVRDERKQGEHRARPDGGRRKGGFVRLRRGAPEARFRVQRDAPARVLLRFDEVGRKRRRRQAQEGRRIRLGNVGQLGRGLRPDGPHVGESAGPSSTRIP